MSNEIPHAVAKIGVLQATNASLAELNFSLHNISGRLESAYMHLAGESITKTSEKDEDISDLPELVKMQHSITQLENEVIVLRELTSFFEGL